MPGCLLWIVVALVGLGIALTPRPPLPMGDGEIAATPRNCATAVARGLSAIEAASHPHLDRDKDGVACYGD